MSNPSLTLKAVPRKVEGKKVKRLRQKGILPAVLYGHGIASLKIQVPYNDFEKVYKEAGSSTLVDLWLDNKKHKVLIHEVETDPLSQSFLHADFYQIKMTEKITAEVPLHFIGESPAVEEQDGVLVKNMDTVEVSCLPADLPSHLDVDLSALKAIDDTIHIKDLKLPSGVEVLKDPEETVVTVIPPRTEEELAELEKEVEEKVEEVEEVVSEKEEKEEEEAEVKKETKEAAEEAK